MVGFLKNKKSYRDKSYHTAPAGYNSKASFPPKMNFRAPGSIAETGGLHVHCHTWQYDVAPGAQVARSQGFI